LPWWCVILGLLLAIVSFIPIGNIQEISGQQIGLNVMSEFLTGSSSSAVAFKTLSYMSMSQGLLLVADLKLGHYLKMRPRTMFVVQLTSTLIASVVNAFAWKLQVDPRDRWASNFNVFLNAGAIWGAIGLACFFDRGSPYVTTVWGFLVGVLAPIFPFVMHKVLPNGRQLPHHRSVPPKPARTAPTSSRRSRSVSSSTNLSGSTTTLGKKKYAYVISAAFDWGTAVVITVLYMA
ncbi:OPT oligopeptide transporter protein-domain-containing protein, partial [Zopfochytrium polystomum]